MQGPNASVFTQMKDSGNSGDADPGPGSPLCTEDGSDSDDTGLHREKTAIGITVNVVMQLYRQVLVRKGFVVHKGVTKITPSF
jgi:hypothetical protein